MWDRTFPINKTLRVICDAVGKAEENLKEHISTYYWNAGEEFITNLFYGQINYCLRQASDERHIENAFLKDLESALGYEHFGDFDLTRDLKSRAAGLVADIVLHNKKTEGRTGGDFGLLIIHPSIHFDSKFLKIKKENCSGLLCQAKLKDKNKKWNKLTKNQRVALEQNRKFSSFVLYSYEDIERRNLCPVLWALCKDKTISNIEEMLKKDTFDKGKLIDTKGILRLLGRKKIGTIDREIINYIVSPSVRPQLELRIHWPDRDDDFDPLKIRTKQYQKSSRL